MFQLFFDLCADVMTVLTWVAMFMVLIFSTIDKVEKDIEIDEV